MDLIKYQNRPCGLTQDLLDAACESFFVQDGAMPRAESG